MSKTSYWTRAAAREGQYYSPGLPGPAFTILWATLCVCCFWLVLCELFCRRIFSQRLLFQFSRRPIRLSHVGRPSAPAAKTPWRTREAVASPTAEVAGCITRRGHGFVVGAKGERVWEVPGRSSWQRWRRSKKRLRHAAAPVARRGLLPAGTERNAVWVLR